MESAYELRFVFVDDGSTDGTWAALHRIFGGRSNCSFVRQEENRGVAAAIMTGIGHARTEIACSIDCDCTYDPHQLEKMIPLLGNADMVTASPYHPDGEVRNVPGWRLVLSKRLSAAYRLVLGRNYHTWTSCFRVYRREAALSVRLTRDGFLGVAELMALLLIAGRRVTEYPATLEVRMLGRSKMRIVRTILGHLSLLARLILARLGGRQDSRAIRAGTPPEGRETAAGPIARRVASQR
jgi:glycosyltransferase involved in cell wall biosynthesis